MKGTDLMQALGGVPEEYIARALEDAPQQNRMSFLVSKPFLAGVSTAACLLLIAGVGVGVWSRQQRIEPLPPQETQTMTVMQSETVTETPAQAAPASQTTRKQTETSRKAAESSVISAILTDRLQPLSEAALLTSISGTGTTTVTTAAKQTTAAEVTSGTLSNVTHTDLPQTSVTANNPLKRTRYTMPAASKPAADTTVPPASFPALEPAEPVSSTTAQEYTTDNSTIIQSTDAQQCPIQPTDAQECSMDEPAIFQPTEPCEPVEPTQPTAIPALEQCPPVIDGFTVTPMEFDPDGLASMWAITAALYPSDPADFQISYTTDSDRYEIREEVLLGSSRLFKVYDNETDQIIYVYQQFRNSFRIGIATPNCSQITPYSNSSMGICGFRYNNIVFWDDGSYIFSMKADEQIIDLPALFRAESH